MVLALLHVAYLLFWWYFADQLAAGLGAAFGACFRQVLLFVGSVVLVLVVLAWSICGIVVLARRAR